MNFDLEHVYDEQIGPLMTQIIAVCKEHGIPMLCSFLYKHDDEEGDDFCTTHLKRDGYENEQLRQALRTIKAGSFFASFIVRETPAP